MKTPITFEQSLRSQVTTLHVNKKVVKEWYRGQFKSPFFHTENDLKIQLNWDFEQDKEILLLDGMPYDNLPYKDPESRLNE